MSSNQISKCCKNESIVINEYDLGSLGKTKFKVCNKHLSKSPWNKHIISQIELGDSID